MATTALARRYDVSEDALQRHRARHLTPALKARLLAGPRLEGVDLEHLREVEGQSWLANMVALRSRLFAALDLAEENADVGQIARIARELHNNAEVLGRYLGELNVGGNHITNILIQPQYITLRVSLVEALEPFPEARQAVAAVLSKLEDDAAKLITADANRTLGK